MRCISILSLTALFSLLQTTTAFSADKAPSESAAAQKAPAEKGQPSKPEAEKPAAKDKCDHGVKKTICTRCNPKLKPVFKAKGDWCAEHDRPESQCAICHADLEKQGVKK